MGRTIQDAVRDACLWLPGAEEVMSHGMPSYKAGKMFANFTVNHHGDGRVSLWLAAPPGAQELYTKADPEHYFVPPYVGPKGWLGVNLNSGLDWQRVASHIREAYLHVAPRKLAADVPDTPHIEPPNAKDDPALIDPMSLPHREAAVSELSSLCLALPETSTAEQWGRPSWKAGKKTFVTAYHRHDVGLLFSFWVGAERQSMLAEDPRFRIPAYTGANGWIELKAEHGTNEHELAGLVEESYRHFALKRMLKALDG